jgi:hypothetical protein
MFGTLATEAQCQLYQNFSLFIRNLLYSQSCTPALSMRRRRLYARRSSDTAWVLAFCFCSR